MFATSRNAKEFLVSRIVAESQREGVPLSEVERKMLYFSETAWTLPDIREVEDAFGREYDMSEYEQKIATLISKFLVNARAHNREEYERWNEAVRTLKKEDHYILVMAAAAGSSVRPPYDLLKLWATGLAIVCVFVLCVIIVLNFFSAR